MNSRLPWTALLPCLAFGWAASARAVEPGWYLVGFGGQSSASASQGQMDENLVQIFESVGLEVTDLASTLDDSDTAFGLGGGYQLNDHFAFEFAYVDLGSGDYQAAVTVTDDVNVADGEVLLESSASGAVLSALGILPVGERFSAVGRVGFTLMNAEGTARITLDGNTDRASQSFQKSNLMVGVAAEYSLGRHSAIRIAWDRYFDVGTDDVTGDIDADLYSLGFRLGVGWFR
jgi:OmpA-OmpF porin, OOP family